jgi:DNA-binding NtrC family response regulator
MITILHPAELPAEYAARLRRLGFATQAFARGVVRELTAQSAEMIYVLPHWTMTADTWPRLRVKLAEASRLYVVCLDHVSTAAVADALRDGAHDVLSRDDTDARWREAITNAATNQQLWLQLYGGRPLSVEDVLIGRSEAMQRLRQTIDRLGPTDVGVFIEGESGVGKERVASALHKAGRRESFVALNCAAIPKDLLEAELFGVEKGAYTGAMKSRAGLAEQANGGTLFLDEIAEMEISVQPKLLRFLETRRARRVGSSIEYGVNVRVISATNRNLDAEIAAGRFRADLYYRLAEIIIRVPPLRNRPEDIPDLALAFLRQANERFGKNFETVEPALIRKFQSYSWPGNVRELKSAVDRLVLLFDGPMLREPWWEAPDTRPVDFTPATDAVSGRARLDRPSAPGHALGGALPNLKQKLALAKRLLAESDNNFTWVAGQLGVNTTTLWRWRKAGKLD